MARNGTLVLLLFSLVGPQVVAAERPLTQKVVVTSPDGKNAMAVDANGAALRFTITRAGKTLIGPSAIGPKLSAAGAIGQYARIVGVHSSEVNESFDLPWGKTRTVANH